MLSWVYLPIELSGDGKTPENSVPHDFRTQLVIGYLELWFRSSEDGVLTQGARDSLENDAPAAGRATEQEREFVCACNNRCVSLESMVSTLFRRTRSEFSPAAADTTHLLITDRDH